VEKIQSVVEIAATPEAVFDVLTNPAYITKIIPDAISAEVDPPGRSAVGQRCHLVAKAERRKIDIFWEVIEVIPNRKVVSIQRPGGIFNSFWQATTLEPRGGKTEAKTIFEYELSLGYIGKVLNVVLAEKLISENLAAYSSMVKELSELIPLRPPSGPKSPRD
jgi:carbon monoxide dehydrogenase subunit G